MQYNEYLKTEHWKTKRASVIKRDGRCYICRSVDNLNVHHMSYKSNSGRSNRWKEHPRKLVTLCRDCHYNWHRIFGKRKSKFGIYRQIRREMEKGVSDPFLTVFNYLKS